MKSLRDIAKAIIARRGYTYFKDDYAPYGIKPFSDIRRLSKLLDYPIRSFFDVGANIGETAQEALSAFPSASLICFEPHPDTFAKLKGRLSGEKRVVLHNLALGSESGTAKLFSYRESSKLNSLVPNRPYVSKFSSSPETVAVQVATLDDFCAANSIDQVDVLKIDTEGFDAMVLRGAQRLLSRGAIKFAYVEFNHILPRAGVAGGSLSEIDELLAPSRLRFVASYTDFALTEGDIFASCNALFALSRN
jgi:FkbM family methyltransferase